MEVYRVKTGSILPLGKQGENLARKIQFDLSRWISNFGPGTVQLLHQRSGDEAPYPVAVEQEGNLAVWTVTSADTAAAGTGRAELQYYVGDALAKSETWMTKVLPALGDASETPPEAQQGWVDQVLAQVARITGMTAQAVELPAGSAPTADYADGVLTIGIPLGGDVSEAQIAQAVAEYLAKNPIAETDPTVPDWAKRPDKPSYTADEVGALSSETMPEAINTALAQAKESGEFDGAAGQDGAPGQDGITPTIGDNGNWYLGDTDTGKPSRGETGPAGADGRDGADGQPGADGKSAYQYAVGGGYTGTEEAFAAKLSKEMPDKLPNPNALTFTGAVTGRYDGSAPLEAEIPSGGGGITVNNTASVGQTVKITAVDENGQPTEWEAVDMASGGGGITAKVEKVYTLEEAVSMFTIPVSDFDPAVYPAIQVALTIPTDCTAIEIGLTVGGQNCKAKGIPVTSKKAYHFIFIGMDNLNRNIPSSIGIGPNTSTMTWKALYWYGYNSGYSDGLYFLVDEATPFPAGATIRVRSV